MVSWKSKWLMACVLGVFGMSSVAEAQDPEQGAYGGSLSASGSARSSGGSGSSSGSSSLYLELQARLDAFNVAGVESTTVDSGDGGGALTAPAIPYVTAGVRLLDGDLFIGLGAGFTSASEKREGPAGKAERSRGSYMLAPVATYDFLGDSPVALYGVGMLTLGSIGRGDNDPGPRVEPGFWWGLNLGAGLRGDITEYVSVFSELGWGFSRGTWTIAGDDHSRFVHGLFGTLGFAVRLGL